MAVDRTASDNLLELIVPGFCEDTLHSPAFTFPLAPNVDPDDFEDAVDQALGLVICPRRLLQVEHGLLAGFGGAASRAVVLLLWSVVAHLFSSLGDCGGADGRRQRRGRGAVAGRHRRRRLAGRPAVVVGCRSCGQEPLRGSW